MIKISMYDISHSVLYIGEFFFLIGGKNRSIGIRITESEGRYSLKIHFLKWMIIIRSRND